MTPQEIAKSRFDNGLQFTEQYFMEEIHRFRKMLGEKSFWARPEEEQDRLISGLSFCYLNVVNDDGSQPDREKIEKLATVFDCTIREYNRRKTFLVMLPLKRALGLTR